MWCGLIGLDFYNTCYGLVFVKEETMKRVGFACHRQFHCFFISINVSKMKFHGFNVKKNLQAACIVPQRLFLCIEMCL